MRKIVKRMAISILLAVIGILLIASPVLAIADPDAIAFTSSGTGRYKAFENVYETGDMLFVAESYIHYVSEPDDYTASEAFSFQLLNAAGDTVLLQTSIIDYEDTVISIYQTATQVTALGLVSGSYYKLRIAGNPTIFGSTVEGTNMATRQLAASDWSDQSTYSGVDSLLYSFCIDVVTNIEASSGTTHTALVDGVTYLDTSGADLFLAGIPSLNVFLPEIFLIATSPMTAEDPAHTGAYQTTLTPTTMLGSNIAKSVTNMASWMGVGSTTAGIIISAILGFILLPVIYFKTHNNTLAMMAASLFVLVCGYLGLFPLAIAFIIASVILILTGFLFWGKITI